MTAQRPPMKKVVASSHEHDYSRPRHDYSLTLECGHRYTRRLKKTPKRMRCPRCVGLKEMPKREVSSGERDAIELRRAQDNVERTITGLKRLVTSIRFWQRRVRYYEKRVALTDEQRAQERKEAEERRRRKKASRRIVV